MKRENWYWDLGMPLEKVREILADEQHPKFPRVAARLLARVDDPGQVFSLVTPLAFCRRFLAIQHEVNKDEWTKEQGAFWRATYERYVREFQHAGVRLRQRQHPERDPFVGALTTTLRQCREALHLSQGEAAQMLGCSQQFVSGVEQGREKLTIDYLQRFARTTGCDFDLVLRPPRHAHAEAAKVAADYTALKAWIAQEHRKALGMARTNKLDTGLMEVVAYVPDAVVNARRDAWGVGIGHAPKKTLQFRQDELRRAMEQSQVHSFGWPIGAVLDRPESEPKPRQDGIQASILVPDRSTFDYWTLRTDLVFYLLKTLFEDLRSEGKVFVDTRIVRTAETLLRISRLYRALNVGPEQKVVISIRYTGLRGRVLSAADPGRAMTMRAQRVCVEDETETWIQERLKDIEPKLVDLVYAAVSELWLLFDDSPLSKERVVQPLVEQFVRANAHLGT